jgi:predicted transcriptional regulator
MVQLNKLKGKIVENNLTIERIAKLLDIDKSTFYRKLGSGGDSFTVKEVNSIIKELALSPNEISEIFFGSTVAQMPHILSNEIRR